MRDDAIAEMLERQIEDLTTHIQYIKKLLRFYDTPANRTRDHLERTPGYFEPSTPTKEKTKKKAAKRTTKKGGGGPGNKTTPEQIKAMKTMYENGIRVKTICEKIGCSDGTVYHYAKINNWKRGQE